MSTLRRSGRRDGAPEHRLDVLTLARRIGSLGTGMAVATCLALCAIVENAVVPENAGHRSGTSPSPSHRHRHGPDGARARTPAGTLTKAVDKAVTRRLSAAARTAYGKDAARPKVRYAHRGHRANWAFGTSVLPAPAGSAAVPEAALFLAHRSRGKWSIGVGGTARFRRLLERAPGGVLPRAERRALTGYAVGYVPGSPAGAGLGLPWKAGRAWTLAGAAGGALTFTGGDGVVRAAGSGRLYRLCSRGLLMIVHPNGLASEYAQVTKVPKIPDGGYVARGAYLGRVGTTAPCHGGRTRARLRFALRSAEDRLPVNGLRLGPWTMHAGASEVWATCPGHRVEPGHPLPNASPAPTPSPKPSPATSVPLPSPTPSPEAPSPEVLR